MRYAEIQFVSPVTAVVGLDVDPHTYTVVVSVKVGVAIHCKEFQLLPDAKTLVCAYVFPEAPFLNATCELVVPVVVRVLKCHSPRTMYDPAGSVIDAPFVGLSILVFVIFVTADAL